MNVFLTGGTGFIGQPLTRSLTARGWNTIALVRKPDSPSARALTRMGVRCVAGDVTDRASMHTAMRDADIVIHNAAWYEVGITKRAQQRMHAINVTGTDNVLSLALELGVPRTVHVSSVVYYGDTGAEMRDETYRRQAPFQMYYEQTKAEAHELAQQYQQRGLPLIIICPANVMGPNDHSPWGYFLRLYLNRLMPPFAWAPKTIAAGVHVNDVATGIALAAEKGRSGETYVLAGEPVSLREMLEIWMTKPGGFRVRFYLPTSLARLLFAALEPVQRLVGLPAFISRETASGASMYMNFSSVKAQRELGWTYQPAKAMWLDIIDQERALLAGRKQRDLISLLKPVEPSE